MLTEQQLHELDSELETYRVKRYSEYWHEEISYIDMKAWYIAKGALTKDGAVIINSHGQDRYDVSGRKVESEVFDTPLYRTLCDEVNEWIDWRSRREYADRKKLEQLDAMRQAISGKMSVSAPVDNSL